ncbi:MAG TPA: hypothetical protein VKT82_00215 [Ktedonobacterales bacterium]|nr:hypothetical protein [Ktedonobacterales bacterium]
MSKGFQELNDHDLTQALESLLWPQLKKLLTTRAPGHCMRMADLDLDLMVTLARALRGEVSNAQVFILGEQQGLEKRDLFISSTKLVELRNPMQDGTLRPPLLVFLPSDLRASAEDSFGVATFEEITVTNIYQALVRSLLQSIPLPLQGHIHTILEQLLPSENWPWANSVAQACYLLTALKNEVDGETLGAALYELGLVPDFRLFDEPAAAQARIRKNVQSMHTLTHSDHSVRGRVLELRLSDKSVQRRLIEFLAESGIEDPHGWTRRIVIDRNNWDLSFDKWAFEENLNPDKISIRVEQTDLPVIHEDETNERLLGLIGSQILAPQERRKLAVVFNVDPHPSQIQGLHHFSVQILTREGSPVGVAKNVKVWQSKKTTWTLTLDKLDKVEFEEGWHFIRVLPWTEAGDPVPITDPGPALSGGRTRPNESEDFYVLPGEVLDEIPPQRAIPQEYSLEHARMRLQFTAIQAKRDPASINPESVTWVNKNSKTRQIAQETIEVRFGRDGAFQLPVTGLLKRLEQRILESPERPVSWRLQIHVGQSEIDSVETASWLGTSVEDTSRYYNHQLQEDLTDWPRSAAVESFLAARAQYFSQLRAGNENLISQAANFLELKEACIQYAEAYQDLLLDLRRKVEQSTGADQQKAIIALRTALAVDTIHINITSFRAKIREAALIGPTHPLRALWLATWSWIGQQWVMTTKDGPEEYVGPVRDALLSGLVPLNIPATVPLADGRVFTTIDNLHPFWSLYAPATEEDTRGLLGEICTSLNLPEPAIGGTAINGEVLAARIERYLVQHPYIRTLIINAFNQGRAAVLADALVMLQRQEAFSHLRYDIRLFVPDPDTPGIGEAIEQLLSPAGSTSAEAVDAFSHPTGSHLFPKLSLAIHSTQDFYANPTQFRAHLSILIDLFPAQEVGAGLPLRSAEIAPLHGLIQDFVIDFQDNESGTYWRRQPLHGEPTSLPGAESLVDLLARLPQVISGATATVAMGVSAFEHRPIVTLGLGREQRELIHHVHDVSDWVYTIDRNIGVEFFDHGGRRDRPDYLIDYLPSSAATFGHRLVITSRSLSELESLLSPVLAQYGLKADGRHATIILEQLRSLSGRLALKLISSPTQQAEVLGLALARLFLKHQGALSNQIILPLDTHLDLFQTIKKQEEELGHAVSLQRTDLALFDLDASNRIIHCNLVEVKCYTQVGGVGAYQQLKEKIAQQINHSQEVLRRHFDPSWKIPDRPDRLLKTRELATLLEFYLGRAVRYELITQDAAAEAQALLATLEDGYSLTFSRSALIFDFEKPGTEPPDNEEDIEYHRIGVDLIQALIAEARPSSTTQLLEQEEPVGISSVPLLTSAAFIAPRRESTASWRRTEQDHRNQVLDPLHGESLQNQQELEESVQDNAGNMALGDDEPRSMPGLPVSSLPVINTANNVSIGPAYDVILGVDNRTPQYGILGEMAGRKVALDLNQTHTISLFGVQGGGKSYTLGTIIEMACLPIPNINCLPAPLATVIFHYSPTQDYKPEFTSMISPNEENDQLALLRERYGAEPSALKDTVLLVPPRKVAARKAEYPELEVIPITFAAAELQAMHWKFLMGAVGSQSMYLRQINLIMRNLQGKLTLESLLQGVNHSTLGEHLKELARTRLQFAGEYIDDSQRLGEIIRPGRLIIVDLRDEFIEKDEALGLFVVLLQIFAEATYQGHSFNKLVVFDEAHKYMESQDLIAGLIEVVREMRHKGTSIMVASQDPPSVPASLIELSSQIILHKFTSPAWLRHIQKANAALNGLTPEKMAQLGPGEAYIWSTKATDEGFSKGAMKIRCRPRVTQHGGSTKTAI